MTHFVHNVIHCAIFVQLTPIASTVKAFLPHVPLNRLHPSPYPAQKLETKVLYLRGPFQFGGVFPRHRRAEKRFLPQNTSQNPANPPKKNNTSSLSPQFNPKISIKWRKPNQRIRRTRNATNPSLTALSHHPRSPQHHKSLQSLSCSKQPLLYSKAMSQAP